MSWLSRASQARRWSRGDWARLAEAWLALAVAWLSLRRWPLPTLLARLDRAAPRHARPSVPPAPLVRAVQRAARLFPVPMLCLPQSLALAWLLMRRGQPCELVLGARPQGGTLDAHAWVEQGGQPLNSAPDSATTHPVYLRHPVIAP